MRIGIDIDDTLTDSFAYFQPFVAEFFHMTLETCRQKGISYSTLPASMKKDELAFAQAYYDRVVPDTPIKQDARDALEKLHEAGHTLLVITARNNQLYTDCVATTTAQLCGYGIPYDRLICTMDKAAVCEEENIDLFIDDSLRYVEAAQAKGIKALLFTSPANQDVKTSVTRVSSWQEILSCVMSLSDSQSER